MISIGKLYTAFKLAPADLDDLRTLLPTRPVIPVNRLIIDQAERGASECDASLELTDELISQYAGHYASKVYKLPRARKRIVELALDQLLDMYRELEFEEGIRLEWNELSASWHSENFYGLLLPYAQGLLSSLREAIYYQLRGSYIFFSLVDLDEAVQFLYGNYYPFHREVKGLTRERFQEISARYFTLPISGSEISPEAVTNLSNQTPLEDDIQTERIDGELPSQSLNSPVETQATPQSPAEPKGIKPSVLIRAIKKEAVRQGLDESYGITVRTLWNWRNKGSTPPIYFSEEVMQSEAAALEFARKFIEEKVSEGSSELAVNAKKEVAYNSQTHGVTIDTPEDTLLVAESFKDLALSMKGGKEAEKKRKAKRKDFE